MSESGEETQPLAIRLVRGIARDARAAIVGVVVVGAPVIANWAVSGDVTLPAWAVVVVAAVLLVVLLVVDSLRHRERERRLRAEGARDEAREAVGPNESPPQPSHAARTVLRASRALRRTVERHALPYAVPGYETSSVEEAARLERLIARVHALMGDDIPRDFAESLSALQGGTSRPDLEKVMGALDEIDAEVLSYGLQHQNDDRDLGF